MPNQRVLDTLRAAGDTISLVVTRHQRGPIFEQLQKFIDCTPPPFVVFALRPGSRPFSPTTSIPHNASTPPGALNDSNISSGVTCASAVHPALNSHMHMPDRIEERAPSNAPSNASPNTSNAFIQPTNSPGGKSLDISRAPNVQNAAKRTFVNGIIQSPSENDTDKCFVDTSSCDKHRQVPLLDRDSKPPAGETSMDTTPPLSQSITSKFFLCLSKF